MPSYAKLIEASYAGEYSFKLKFSDGVSGTVDFTDELWGEMFEPLKDKKLFASAKISPEIPVLVWENGADFAPEFLYERAKQNVVN